MSCSSPYSWSGCDMENTWDGVDKFDTMMMKKLYAKLGHGSQKVWRHLLWYLVNMAIFRLELAEHLIGFMCFHVSNANNKCVRTVSG